MYNLYCLLRRGTISFFHLFYETTNSDDSWGHGRIQVAPVYNQQCVLCRRNVTVDLGWSFDVGGRPTRREWWRDCPGCRRSRSGWPASGLPSRAVCTTPGRWSVAVSSPTDRSSCDRTVTSCPGSTAPGLQLLPVACPHLNPLKGSGGRWLHFEVFSAIQV